MGKATQGTSPRARARVTPAAKYQTWRQTIDGIHDACEHGECHDGAYVVQTDMW